MTSVNLKQQILIKPDIDQTDFDNTKFDQTEFDNTEFDQTEIDNTETVGKDDIISRAKSELKPRAFTSRDTLPLIL